MLVEQNYKCAICNEDFKKNEKICIDHNHETDKVRGLLCGKCNTGLGLFNDDKEILINAAIYLNKQ